MVSMTYSELSLESINEKILKNKEFLYFKAPLLKFAAIILSYH